mmetsp:Transcript_24145/g.47478  ORF Transcript_24145/g.47478 Transcript_24145/m.47478 type:complete len:214 (-) Transcript_24145:1212-1853(-)
MALLNLLEDEAMSSANSFSFSHRCLVSGLQASPKPSSSSTLASMRNLRSSSTSLAEVVSESELSGASTRILQRLQQSVALRSQGSSTVRPPSSASQYTSIRPACCGSAGGEKMLLKREARLALATTLSSSATTSASSTTPSFSSFSCCCCLCGGRAGGLRQTTTAIPSRMASRITATYSCTAAAACLAQCCSKGSMIWFGLILPMPQHCISDR